MKKEQREVYLALATEIGYALCVFCSFRKCSACQCYECMHPLEVINSNEYMGEPGLDCWGFRPFRFVPNRVENISLMADIAGMMLAKKWDGGISWWRDRKSQWCIAGVTVGDD